MASDKMLGSFDQKSAPEDNDLLVEYDASASKVKNVKFGGVWNWIVKKLTSAVINELQTSSKNVVGAINELNSKRVVVNGSSTQICLEKYKTAIVFGTVNTVGQSLILISRNYKDQIDIKSLCGASETSITGNVNLETENVTLNFSGNNSAIIIW